MHVGREEANIQGTRFRFGARASHVKEVGCTVRITVGRVLRQQDLGDGIGGHGVEVRRAIEHTGIKDEVVYLDVGIVGRLSGPGLAEGFPVDEVIPVHV